MTISIADIMSIYKGSDGYKTKELYDRITALGPFGVVATNLFRACKCSERAKMYRGGRYKSAAYDRKDWSIGNVCRHLETSGLPIVWGWGIDEVLLRKGDPHHHILYVDIPSGQVSFHSGTRAVGPKYTGVWDGAIGLAPKRICEWCHSLLSGKAVAAKTVERAKDTSSEEPWLDPAFLAQQGPPPWDVDTDEGKLRTYGLTYQRSSRGR